MGNDGGALTSKRKVLNALLKADHQPAAGSSTASAGEAQHAQRADQCQRCALSRAPLWPPVCADREGRLMRRSAVVELLLARKAGESADTNPLLRAEAAQGIRRLKDTVELRFSTTPSVQKLIDTNDDSNAARTADTLMFCSAKTGANLSAGTTPFGFFWECGHCVAAAAATSSEDNRNNGSSNGTAAPSAAGGGNTQPMSCPVCGDAATTSGMTWVLAAPFRQGPAARPDGAPSSASAPLRTVDDDGPDNRRALKSHRPESVQ